MKKNVFLILIVTILTIAVVTTVCAINNDFSIINFLGDETKSVTESNEEPSNVDTLEPSNTEPEDVHTGSIETEPNVNTVIDTSATAEPEPTENHHVVEQPTETQSKTYYCDANYFKRGGFLTQPECIPALTLNDDGTMIFRVYYIGGVTDVPGTYVIEDNKIYIYCVLEGTPVYGFYSDGMAWMDDKFMFEIVNDDTLTIHAHPDDTGSFRCYAVNAGDPFVRK